MTSASELIRSGGMTMRLSPSASSSKSGKPKNAIALFGAILSDGQQTGEAAPGGAIFRIGQNVGRAVAENQARADRDLEADDLGHRMGAHDAGDRVAVGDADTDETKLLGAQDQLFGF